MFSNKLKPTPNLLQVKNPAFKTVLALFLIFVLELFSLAQTISGNFIQPVDYKLTGLARFGGKNWVFLASTDSRNDLHYLNLREGEIASGVKILEVDFRSGSVKILNQGVIVFLSFETRVKE